MALYGLSLILQRLPAEHIAEKREEWETFVAEKRLWRLARHQNPYVRDRMLCVHSCLMCWLSSPTIYDLCFSCTLLFLGSRHIACDTLLRVIVCVCVGVV